MANKAVANKKAAKGVEKTTKVLKPNARKRAHKPKTLQIAADGRSRAVKQIQLPANAIVDRFDLVVTAKRADLVKALDAADMRSAADAATPALVVDFGTLRTVNAVLLPTHHSNHKVYPWLGTKFDTTAIELPDSSAGTVSRGEGDANYSLHIYPIPETRTERLRIELGNSDAVLESVMEVLELSLPELPADLSLRIDGGAPVWEHSGTVQLATSAVLDENGWTGQGQRRVSIADALAQFSGDATSPEMVDLTLELTSSVPGMLDIAVGAKTLRLLHRLGFDGREELNLEFDSEGEQQFYLSAPDGVASEVSGVRIGLRGEPTPERVLPPLGPEPNNIGELLLGNGRAACVRLDGGDGLAELTAVRVPLESKSSSAEASVILWSDQDGVPVKALSEAVSEPVNWSGSDEQWIAFRFAEPFPFDPAAPPWAALVVNRGEAIWKMAAGNANGDNPLRLGAPEGPWRALPAVFGAGTALGRVAGRVHIAGLADAAKPLAPLLISLDGGPADRAVTPTEEGLRIQLDVEAPAQAGAVAQQDGGQAVTSDREQIAVAAQEELGLVGTMLRVVSRSAWTVTLSEVDVITREK